MATSDENRKYLIIARRIKDEPQAMNNTTIPIEEFHDYCVTKYGILFNDAVGYYDGSHTVIEQSKFNLMILKHGN